MRQGTGSKFRISCPLRLLGFSTAHTGSQAVCAHSRTGDGNDTPTHHPQVLAKSSTANNPDDAPPADPHADPDELGTTFVFGCNVSGNGVRDGHAHSTRPSNVCGAPWRFAFLAFSLWHLHREKRGEHFQENLKSAATTCRRDRRCLSLRVANGRVSISA